MRITKKQLVGWLEEFAEDLNRQQRRQSVFLLRITSETDYLCDRLRDYLATTRSRVVADHYVSNRPCSTPRSICSRPKIKTRNEKAFHVTSFPCSRTTQAWCISWDAKRSTFTIKKHQIGKCPHAEYL